MVVTGGRGKRKVIEDEAQTQDEEADGNTADYEESRAQRIKKNMERMKNLGILDLSKKLKPSRTVAKSSFPSRKTKDTATDPPRRSSRLKYLPLVSYSEKKIPKESKAKNVVIRIPEGINPEIYTEEHEKLLGDSEAVWELCVDGHDEDGQLIYDPFQGKSCHQCRQKTMGLRTKCYKCDGVTGQLCGDCLYMRYGENIVEVNEKPTWVCPLCRGICNCSRCRRDKGWEPTGAIYRKVQKLGYKSVAHYLIYTRRGQAVTEADTAQSPVSGDEVADTKGGSSDAEMKVKEEENLVDSDEEFRRDDYEEDDSQ